MRASSGALRIAASALLTIGALGASAQPVESKFIEGLPALEPSPLVPGAYAWMKGGVDFGSYDKIMLDRVQFVYADDSQSKAIDPAQLAAIGTALLVAIRNAMEPQYPVVDKEGPGVLRLRIGITEVRVDQVAAEKPARGIFGVMPAGLALNALTAAAASETDLSQARIEASGGRSPPRRRLLASRR